MSNKIIKTFVLLIILFCPLFIFAKSLESKNSSRNFSRAKYSGYQNELLVIGSLKNLYTAQANYFSTVGNRQFGNLAQLRAANLIDEYLAAGEKFGYIFSIQLSGSGFTPKFIILAKPKNYRKTGKRSFYFNAECVVRGADKNGFDAEPSDAIVETCTPTIAYDNERTAIQTMRLLISAQETYKATVGNGNYGTFFQLYNAGLISNPFEFGSDSNYYYQIQKVDYVPNTSPARFWITATPAVYRQMGFRSFFTDTSHIIRGADHQGQNGNENDPPIEDSIIKNF